MFRKLKKLGKKISYHFLDKWYVPLDRGYVMRTKNIKLIPKEEGRKGGKYSYAEWAHVIGIFQTLFFIHLNKKEENDVLDVGCGTGLLGIASEPFLGAKGSYTGLDVVKWHIDFCSTHYERAKYSFVHFNANNPMYASHQEARNKIWPLEDSSFDLVTALSVWTHLNEEDAVFYFKEISRVLKPGAKAIVTFFLLDDSYKESLPTRSKERGRFNATRTNHWIFDRKAYGSNDWFHPGWAKVPEEAIGITEAGLDKLLQASGLIKVAIYPGSWKETPGVFFQDVMVFEKSEAI